jgi:hypothetical protein
MANTPLYSDSAKRFGRADFKPTPSASASKRSAIALRPCYFTQKAHVLGAGSRAHASRCSRFSSVKDHIMALKKFGEGQSVSIVRSGSFSAPAGVYRIVRVLPLGDGPQQYRVRNASESFDRVIDEARLEAVRYD